MMTSSSSRAVSQACLARLLISTALISAAPVIFLPGPALGQDVLYLDNVDQSADSGINPGSGTWASGSVIWSDIDGNNHDSLSRGDTAVLRPAELADPAGIVLDIEGTVLPGTIRAEGSGFTLNGGTIGDFLNAVTFELVSESTLTVSSDLGGRAIVAGNGIVYFTGEQTANRSMTVTEDATLDSSGETTGTLRVQDSATAIVRNRHDGNATVAENATITLISTGVIEGDLDLDGTALLNGTLEDLSISETGTARVTGDLRVDRLTDQQGELRIESGGSMDIARDGLVNAGTLFLSGAVTFDGDAEETTNTGTIVLEGGSLAGGLRNEQDGVLQFASDLETLTTTTLAGDLINEGEIAVTGSGPMELDLGDATFTNLGQVHGTGSGTVRILANLFALEQGSTLNMGVVELIGRIENNGTLLVTAARQLTEDMLNDADGQLILSDQLDANGLSIQNNGVIRTEADALAGTAGAITGLTDLTSDGQIQIGEGTRVQADNTLIEDEGILEVAGRLETTLQIDGDAEVELQGGVIAGAVTNEGELQGDGLIDGTLTNLGVVTATGDLSVAALDNSGTVSIDTGAILRAATDILNAGVINLTGTLDIATGAGRLVNQATQQVNFNGGRLQGDLINDEDGTVDLAGNSTVAGNVVNNGTMVNSGSDDTTLELESGTFTNSGLVTSTDGGQLTIIADRIELLTDIDSALVNLIGQIFNAAGLDYTADTVLRGDLNNADGSRVRVMADVDADGFNVTNEGDFQIGANGDDGNLAGVAVFDNSGDLTVREDSTLATELLTNQDGATTTIGGEITGEVRNAAGGDLVLDGGVVTGPVDNAGGLTGEGEIAGQLVNAGTAALAGSVQDIASSGTLTTSGDLAAGTLSNTGQVTVGAGHQLSVENGMQNDGTAILRGELTGSVVNTAVGTLDMQGGALAGSLDNRGQLIGRGRLDNVTTSGTLRTTGLLDADLISNSGQVTIATGSELTTSEWVDNTGSVTIDGRLRGNLVNQAGGDTVIAGSGRIVGAVSNAGLLTSRGTIDGDLSNDGTADLAGTVGALTNNGDLDLTGLLRADSVTSIGAVTVDAADTLAVAGPLTTSGTLTVSGRVSTTETLSNLGDGVVTLQGGVIDGDVSNTLNARLTMDPASRIDGTLSNSGNAVLAGMAGDISNLGTLDVNGQLQLGDLTNTGVGRVTVGTGDALTATGQIFNEAVMQIAGTATLQGSGSVLTNRGALTLTNAQINGDVVNDDQLTIAASSRIAGDLDNRAMLAIAADDETELDLTGFTFRNSGQIIRRGDGTARILADLFQLQQGSVIDTALIELVGRIDNAGQFLVTAATRLSDGLINLDGGTIQVSAQLDASDQDITNDGTLTIATGPATGVPAEVVNVGDFVSSGSTVITAGTRLQAQSSRVADGGDLSVGGGLDSGLRIDQGGTAVMAGGTVSGDIENDGVLRGAGLVQGLVVNTGQVRATGLLDLAGLENTASGLTVVEADATLRSASDIANAGRVDLSGTMQVTSAAGQFRNLADAQLNLSGGRVEGTLLNDQDGVVTVSGTSSVSGNVVNSGTIQMTEGGTASLEVEGGSFTNRGLVQSINRGRLTIIAQDIILESPISNRFVELIGRVLNVTRLDFDQDSSLTAELNNGEGGSIGIYADLDAAGFDVTNDGLIEVGDAARDGQLRDVATLTNRGRLTIAQGSRVEATQTSNATGGEIAVGGTLTGSLSNGEGGEISLSGGTIEGPVTNAGALSGTGTITGALSNSGTATLGGQAGVVTNSGTLSTQGRLDVGSLISGGNLVVGSGTTLQVDSAVQNRGQASIGGTLQGDLTNGATGRLDLTNGTITGNVQNAAEARLRGTIGGGLSNSGRLTTTGNLSVDGLDNSAEARVAAGHVLTASDGVTNTGDLALGGTLAGDLRNRAGGTTTLTTGSRIDGAVQNAGTLRGSTTVAGPLSNSGTAQISGSVGAVTNIGTLAMSGALAVDSLANGGTVQVGAGQALNVQGAVTNAGTIALDGRLTAGDGVRNDAGGTIALDGATVVADVTNAADGLIQIVSDSSIAGDLTNRGMIDLTGTAPDVTLSVQNGTFTNSGVVQVSGSGFLTIEADEIVLEDGSQVDNSRVDLVGAVSNDGDLVYRRDAALDGDLRNGTEGSVGVLADLDGAGNDIVNNGSLIVGQSGVTGSVTGLGSLVNEGDVQIGAGSTVAAVNTQNNQGGTITVAGSLGGNVQNAVGAQIGLTGGTIGGNIRNDGLLSGDGSIVGSLVNTGTAIIQGNAVAVDNSGSLQTAGDLAVAGLVNSSQTSINAGDRLTSDSPVISSGTMSVAGMLDGSVASSGTLGGSGQITGSVESRGQLIWTGSIGGGLLSTDVARLSGTVGGNVRNEGRMTTTGDLSVGGTLINAAGAASAANVGIAAEGDGAALAVSQGTVLTADGGIANETGATLINDGRIVGDLDNRGYYLQSGVLQGSVVTRGQAQILGSVTGNLDYVSGQLTLADDVRIGGDLTLRQDYAVDAGRTLEAGRTIIADDTTLSLGGRLDGALSNAGTVAVSGDQASVTGTVTNNGELDLTGGNRVGDVLQVGGLSGDGTVSLDVDLSQVTADRIEVRGGAADGFVRLEFNQATPGTVSQPGRRVTLLDVDERFAAENTFSYSANTDFAASERIVFSVEQLANNGDLTLVSQTNPAIGALFGNVALTQSLIGSVVNRPTSPFVTGLAFEDPEKPCGAGAWGRMTGGTATAEGATDNGVSSVDSKISATYYGLQVGSDLACFDGRFAGWNTAFGVLGGVNQGSTTQPIYAIDGRNSQNLSTTLSSVTTADFTQGYAGVYATATRGRMQADLQLRHELTDFDISNRAVAATGSGLGLDNAEFSSAANTLSGSFSYVVPLGQDSGWSFVPTAGFAWSRLSTDPVRFDDDYRLSFDDSERQIGFIGGTLARTYVQPDQNTALYAFATTTFYKDFADPTVSVFSNESDPTFDAQRLVSDNLGSYGEFSLGANYIKIIGEGYRARQFSTSSRLDVRYGNSLDSIGVTGQVRWQF
ncbi:hypothetical protein [Paracoccus sp. Ld10]|uniref:hypothetical protein n=1 Tax=Paracoccus sp. Ld10 TaxID=649158 RepID=UPI00386465C0